MFLARRLYKIFLVSPVWQRGPGTKLKQTRSREGEIFTFHVCWSPRETLVGKPLSWKLWGCVSRLDFWGPRWWKAFGRLWKECCPMHARPNSFRSLFHFRGWPRSFSKSSFQGSLQSGSPRGCRKRAEGNRKNPKPKMQPGCCQVSQSLPT